MYLPMKLFLQAFFLRVIAACALAIGLVACGGGGGTTPTVTNVLPTPSVSISPANYAAGTAEIGAYTALQTARVLCGFGEVKQDPKLDAASLAHAIYLVNKSFASGTSVLSHYERDANNLPDVNNPDFTGEGLGERAVAQGYIYWALAEILEATSQDYPMQPTLSNLEERGASSVRNLLNTVYHLSGAMYEGRDVGVGAYQKSVKINSTTWREEYRFGALVGYKQSASPVVLGARQIATYPCTGIINIPPSFAPANESPNPFPNSSQLVGPPIYVKVDAGQTLVLTSYSIRLKNGPTVPTVLIDYAYDQRIAKEVGLNESFVVPNVALIPSATYQVTLKGTIGGIAFPTRSFEFSTSS
jgi:hypothetical protein